MLRTSGDILFFVGFNLRKCNIKTLCFNHINAHLIYPILNNHLKICLFIWHKSWFKKFLPSWKKYLSLLVYFLLTIIILIFFLASVRPIEGKHRPHIKLPKPVFLCFKLNKFFSMIKRCEHCKQSFPESFSHRTQSAQCGWLGDLGRVTEPLRPPQSFRCKWGWRPRFCSLIGCHVNLTSFKK